MFHASNNRACQLTKLWIIIIIIIIIIILHYSTVERNNIFFRLLPCVSQIIFQRSSSSLRVRTSTQRFQIISIDIFNLYFQFSRFVLILVRRGRYFVRFI